MNNTTTDIAGALSQVRRQITLFAEKHGRDPDTVSLLAVSKTKPAARIQAAHAAGQRDFGENYADEALEKMDELSALNASWHFIGAIQSRKAAGIAKHFDWVHSVDRFKVARKLSENRPANAKPLQICLQVNIDNEASKSGVSTDDVAALAAQCADLPHLQLRGLMAIPAIQTELESQRKAFAKLRVLMEELKSDHPALDTLSMGMSGDLEAAIAEGATIVRVGTALFGARARPVSD